MKDTSTVWPTKGPTDDTLRLGICPANETEPDYGLMDYRAHAMDKGCRYAALLRLAYPGARIAVTYDGTDPRRPEALTVCLVYDTDDPAQVAQSYEIEDTLPRTWAELETMAEAATPSPAEPTKPETKPIPTETPKKDNHMHDLNSILLEGVVRISPIYTEHKDGLTVRFVLVSTRRPKDSEPVTIFMPIDAHGRLAEELRTKYRPDTYIRVVGRLAPNSQPSAPPAVVIDAEHIEFRAFSNLT